jgi:hypothetical protein
MVLENIIFVHEHRDIPARGQSDMFFLRLNTNKYSPVTAETMSATFFSKEGYGRIIGGTRVLELAADSREAALGYLAS